MKAYARLNHGRWIVDCPLPTCSSATMVAKGRKTYRCPCPDTLVCVHPKPRMVAHGKGERPECGQRWTIVWPDNLADIEALMRGRPGPNCNWEPGESLAMLRADNIEHGIEKV